MDAFDQLVAQAAGACAQSRAHQRLRAHLLAQLVCLGPHTITGLLRTLGEQFRDWSAAYRLYGRARFDPSDLFGIVRRDLEQGLAPDQPLVVALDDSILRKTGRKIPAAAWRVDPLGAPFQVSFVWAQRVLQMSALWPEGQEGAARAVPIDFALAPTPARPRRDADEAQWACYRQEQKRLNINSQALARLRMLSEQRDRDGQRRALWVTVDGRFTNKTFLQQTPAGIVTIGRIRGDARLHAAVEPSGATSGGQPRRYGQVLPTPCLLYTSPSPRDRQKARMPSSA